MITDRSFFANRLWAGLLLTAVFLAACGTFEVGVEPTSGPEATAISPASTSAPDESPTATATVALELTVTPADETTSTRDMFTLSGQAMAIDPPTGTVILLPEQETPFADSNGEVRVRISEWAHIVDSNGAIVNINEFSRGIKLELKLQFVGGVLTSEEVTVLERGVSPLEENPAYTDVTDLVTPIAEILRDGNGIIQLFEVESEELEGAADPGSALTLKWAFSGESGTICVSQMPRPITPTCYQDLPPTGAMPVTIPADAREAIIYSLNVPLEDRVETADIRIPLSVGLGCPNPWFFEHEYLLGCAAGAPVSLRPQAQTFDKGMMIRLEESWLGQTPYLFAFIWDGEQEAYGFSEGPLPDAWTDDLPEQVVGEEPPAGKFRPSRGFGLLWSGQLMIPQMGEPRTLDGLEILGWASGPVQEYEARYQCDEELFDNFNCYLSLPDGQVVALPGRAP